ncbi:unnamed protein product [Fraxinus pennsylvanica]|uniref:Uncharacterized protein n=1 Tax=Fraxinus pennsylvanica TaxID=56036 RepID=A0AAD1ZMZ2_9LAMI|nr:unnamed protein product [Fraxinus pennsylvanica]
MNSSYSQVGLHHEALKLYGGIVWIVFYEFSELATDLHSCNSDKATVRTGNIGLKLHELATEQGLFYKVFVGEHALVDMYDKCGSLDNAKRDEERDINLTMLHFLVCCMGVVTKIWLRSVSFDELEIGLEKLSIMWRIVELFSHSGKIENAIKVINNSLS